MQRSEIASHSALHRVGKDYAMVIVLCDALRNEVLKDESLLSFLLKFILSERSWVTVRKYAKHAHKFMHVHNMISVMVATVLQEGCIEVT